jgi:hypothetical protein
MMTVKLEGHQQVISMLGDIAKQQAPFAMSQTINDLLFKGKQAINEAQDKKYEGGATRWSKSGFGYVKSTKQLLTGLIFLSDNPAHEYLKFGINGGLVHPLGRQKAIKIPSKGQGLNKYGNFRFSGGKTFAGSAIQKAQTSQTHFIGIPKNIERMPFFKGGSRDDYYGVWLRQGPKGTRGGIGRKEKITMQVGLDKNRTQRAYFKSPEQYAINLVKKQFLPIFRQRILKAIATAK